MPLGLTARVADGALHLSWSPVAAPDLSGCRIHVADASPQRLAVGRETQLKWTGLQPGRTYQESVSAYSTEGLESEPGAPVSVFVQVPAPSTSLRVDWPTKRLTNPAELTILPLLKDLTVARAHAVLAGRVEPAQS